MKEKFLVATELLKRHEYDWSPLIFSAYMAPEVFTKNMNEGYGRAADIWSVGCVVIEMATGKRPWFELESNYQIMFKVGMGESPQIPLKISNEGKEFLALCFEHDPKHRGTAEDLLSEPFLKVSAFSMDRR